MSGLHNDLDTIENALMALHRAMYHQKTWTNLQRASGVGLDRAGASLLKAVESEHAKQIKMQDIAQALGIEAPSVSRKVQQLTSEGLLQKSADKADGRASNLVLTKLGREQLTKLKKAKRKQLASRMQNWTSEDREHFSRLLQRFAADITDSHQPIET